MMTVPGLMAGAYALSHDRVATLFLHRAADPTQPDDPGQALVQAYGELGWILPDLLDRRPAASEIYYAHLVERLSAGRFRFHDLVRLYAAAKARAAPGAAP